jgi:hypothetical protein
MQLVIITETCHEMKPHFFTHFILWFIHVCWGVVLNIRLTSDIFDDNIHKYKLCLPIRHFLVCLLYYNYAFQNLWSTAKGLRPQERRTMPINTGTSRLIPPTPSQIMKTLDSKIHDTFTMLFYHFDMLLCGR